MAERKSVWKRRLVTACFLLVVLYALAGFVGLPLLLRHVGLKKANEALAGEIRIKTIYANPFSYSLTLKGVSVVTPDGETVFAAKRAYGNFAFWSLFDDALRFQELTLVDPQVTLSADKDGKFNVNTLLAQKATPPQEPETPEELAERNVFHLPLVLIDRLRVKNGGLKLALVTPGGEFRREINAANFTLHNFSTDPHSENAYDFTAQLDEQSETVGVKGVLQLNPLSTRGTVSLEAVSLKELELLAGNQIGFGIADGLLGVQFDYLFSPVSDPRGLFIENGNLVLERLTLLGNGEQTPFQSLEKLEVKGFGVDLIEGHLRVDSIRSANAQLHLARDKEGILNLTRYFVPQSGQKEAAAAVQADKAAAQKEIRLGVIAAEQDIGVALTSAWQQMQRLMVLRWKLDVGFLESVDNTLRLHDAFPEREVVAHFSKAAIQVRDLRNYGDKPFNYHVSASLAEEGRLVAEGRFTPEPQSATLRYSLRNLDLAPFGSYLGSFTTAKLISLKASSNGEGSIVFPAEGLPEAKLAFNAKVEDLHIDSPAPSDPVLTAKAISLEKARAATNPPSLHADLLLVQQPLLNIVRDEQGKINLLELFPALEAKEPAKPVADGKTAPAGKAAKGGKVRTKVTGDHAEAVQPVVDSVSLENFSLRELRIEGGTLRVTDNSVRPPAAFALRNAAFTLTPVELKPDTVSRFDASANLTGNAQGRVGANGELILLDPLKAAAFTLTSSGLTMTPFGGYAEPAVGRPLQSGSVDASLQYTIRDGKIKGENNVSLNRIGFGKRLPDSQGPNLPLELGMAILSDRSGVMKLDVPVSGDLNDPDFSMTRVIGYALVNVFQKLVTAPFAVLDSLFSAGGVKPSAQVDFEPAKAEIPASQTAGLSQLAVALYERPGLALVLAPVADAPADKEPMRAQVLQAKIDTLAKAAGMSPDAAVDGLFDSLIASLSAMPQAERTRAEALIADALQRNKIKAPVPPPAPVVTQVPVQASSADTKLTISNWSIIRPRRGPTFLPHSVDTEVTVQASASATELEKRAAPASAAANADTASAATGNSAAMAGGVATGSGQATSGKDGAVDVEAARRLPTAEKRRILLALTEVSAADLQALASARAAAVAAALTGDASHPLDAARLKIEKAWQPQESMPERKPTPTVYFDLTAAEAK